VTSTCTAKTAYGYLRCSTFEQASEGVTLDAQRDRITAYCQTRGFDLAGVIEDAGISGKSTKNRPGLREALSRVKRGEILVVYSLSRLARSTIDLLSIEQELKRRGVELASVTEQHLDTTTSHGIMNFQVMAAFTEFERRCISERTKFAMAHLRRLGRFTGGVPPLGYRVEGQFLVPVPEEQAILSLVYQLRREGLSYRSIVGLLKDRGIVNRKGKPFALAQIQRILSRLSIKAVPTTVAANSSVALASPTPSDRRQASDVTQVHPESPGAPDDLALPFEFIHALLDHALLDQEATDLAARVLSTGVDNLNQAEVAILQERILEGPAGRDCLSPRAHEVETWEDRASILNDPDGWCPRCRRTWDEL